jgi:putative aminopeptidase FrvX
VVATQNEEVFGVLDLVSEQEADSLERLLATVDVVTEEEVVGLRGETAIFEETQEIIVLTVDVTANLGRVDA